MEEQKKKQKETWAYLSRNLLSVLLGVELDETLARPSVLGEPLDLAHPVVTEGGLHVVVVAVLRHSLFVVFG